MKSDKNILIIIGLLSATVIGFLFWLIYFKPAASSEGLVWVNYLPLTNAILNTITSAFLITGYYWVKRGNLGAHKQMMYAATLTSALFLVSYLTYHHFQGDTKFLATGWVRPVYFFILITHVLLSIVQVPLILTTLYFAFTEKFTKHRKVARITFPIWLYVSVTGVLVFIFLKAFN